MKTIYTLTDAKGFKYLAVFKKHSPNGEKIFETIEQKVLLITNNFKIFENEHKIRIQPSFADKH